MFLLRSPLERPTGLEESYNYDRANKGEWR